MLMGVSVSDQLAILRMVLVPVVMGLIMSDVPAWAAALFVIAAITDFLDGYLARRMGQLTTLGAFLDSTADKMLVTGTFLALIAVDRASIWIAGIIITREFAVMALRSLAGLEGIHVPPSIWGKLKANAQFIALGFAIVRSGDRIGGWYFDEYLMVVAVVLTLYSGWDYIRGFFVGRPSV